MAALAPLHQEPLRREYESLQREATRMAGELTDLARRGTIYHHLYEHSGRNHVFPLIAAHGALWARGYFRFGLRMGRWLALPHLFAPAVRRHRLDALDAFANALRDINRRVCIDTYASYHFTERHGDDPLAAQLVLPALLAALQPVHAAREAGTELTDEQKRRVFEAFFRHEQETVVGPSVAAAAEALDWPLIRSIALKPVIGFAYFPRFGRLWPRKLWFRNFARQEERIRNGLQAFDWAAAAGWQEVEAALARYEVLPREFFAAPAAHFAALRIEA